MPKTEENTVQYGLPRAVFLGLRYAVVLLVISIFLLTVLYIVGLDWMGHAQTVCDYICYAGVVLGAFVAGQKLKTRGWLGGIILALIYWVLLLVTAKIFGLQVISLKLSAVKLFILVLMGAVGGIIGVNL